MMFYDEPMTTEEKYEKLVRMVDSLLRESKGRMETTHELYMLERDSEKAARLLGRSNRNHDVYKALKTLDDYIDLLDQVPTK